MVYLASPVKKQWRVKTIDKKEKSDRKSVKVLSIVKFDRRKAVRKGVWNRNRDDVNDANTQFSEPTGKHSTKIRYHWWRKTSLGLSWVVEHEKWQLKTKLNNTKQNFVSKFIPYLVKWFQ